MTVRFSLDLVATAVCFEPGFPFNRWATKIRINIPIGAVPVNDGIEILAVMHCGGIALQAPDDLVLSVNIDRQLVTKVVFAMLLSPAGIDILLPTLGRLPIGWQGLLVQQFFIASPVMLLWSGYQGGINDLTATGNEGLLEQLR